MKQEALNMKMKALKPLIKQQIYMSQPLLSNMKNNSYHKVDIYPREEIKYDYYPLVIKKKRDVNSTDLYSKLKHCDMYNIYTKKQLEEKKDYLFKRKRNFQLITEENSRTILPLINNYNHSNSKNDLKKYSASRNDDIKTNDCLSLDKYNNKKKGYDNQQNKMLNVILSKSPICKAMEYDYNKEYDRIHINDEVRLYKNSLTVPCKSKEKTPNEADQEDPRFNLHARRFETCRKDTMKYIENPLKLNSNIPPLNINSSSSNHSLLKPKKTLKEINDNYLNQYRQETKEYMFNEIQSALRTKELLSDGIDLVLKDDAEYFNRMQFESDDN